MKEAMFEAGLPVVVHGLELEASDGHPLAATLFEPEGGRGERVALVASSMGLTQQLYVSFSRFLAARGWVVVTFDYRGIGGSCREPVAISSVGMRDWGEKDLTGVIGWIDRRLQPRRLVLVAHSIGGQVIGFAANHDRLDAMLAVAPQKVYWRYWPRPRRYLIWAAHRATPGVVRLFGRFPGWIFDSEEMTAEMVLDWWRWGAQPGYPEEDGVCLDERFKTFFAPILALSFADDPIWSPPRSVEALLGLYANASSLHWHLKPRELGLARIGHSGFFDEAVGTLIWDEIAGWLEAGRVPALPGVNRVSRSRCPATADPVSRGDCSR